MADNFVTNPAAGGDTFAADDIAGVKWQRVKLGTGADGVANDVAAGISDGIAPSTVPASGVYIYDRAASTWYRQQDAGVDGGPTANSALVTPGLYNGSTIDRQRGNTEEAYVIAPAARTVGTNSPDLYNYNARGARIILNVSAKAGATTLTPTFYTYAGTYCMLGVPFAAWAAEAGTVASFDMYPGIPVVSSGGTQSQAFMLPRHWILNIQQSDADSITYSASVQYIV